MKKRIKDDLKEFSLMMEDLLEEYRDLPEADLIDIGALIKPISKGCEEIDTYIKDQVKEKLKHNTGTRLGNMFKAVLKIVPVKRLDQKALKEGSPAIHAKYTREYEDERITFELR